MKVWIYLNGLQQGPYTMDQLRLMPVGPDTPVWYEGLPQWTPAASAPLLAGWFGGQGAPAPAAESPGGEPAEGAAPTAPSPAADIAAAPPRPRTYLVWCILLTVLCCSPFGLAGIITGSMATSRYNQGRYAQAQSMSEATEWLLMLAIVFALIGLPLMLALSAL